MSEIVQPLAGNYVEISREGLMGILRNLPIEEVVLAAQATADNIVGNATADVPFCLRLVEHLSKSSDPEALALLASLTRATAESLPFHLDVLELYCNLFDDPDVRERVALLRKYNPEADELLGIGKEVFNGKIKEAELGLERMQGRHPSCVIIASLLLEISRQQGKVDTRRLNRLQCPPEFKQLWLTALFKVYAELGMDKEAMGLFKTIGQGPLRPEELNLAAELFRRRGDTARCLELYGRSIERNPAQTPVRHRMAELENPRRKRPELVDAKRVLICLYTFNKDVLFAETLDSLSRTNVGGADILILLNGCTDHSRDAAQAFAGSFPNDVEIIDLPVNVGAPQARNWLLNHRDLSGYDYVAFLDDDVDLPEDWLEWYLTIGDENPRLGLIGCKVTFPGTPAKLQYLHRSLLAANKDMLKLTFEAPFQRYDTGTYDYVRRTLNVMGCCHMYSTAALRDAPAFDIRFSPSQVDDIDHALKIALAGWDVVYCGLVNCVHKQSSGIHAVKKHASWPSLGNVLGNDIKLFFNHLDHLDDLNRLAADLLRR